MTRDCQHAIAVGGRTYRCRLHDGHRYQHRALVTTDRAGLRGGETVEIVWPNPEQAS